MQRLREMVTPIARFWDYVVNPLERRGNYSATSKKMKLVYWPLMGGMLHSVHRGGTGLGRSPPSPLLAVPNVATHPLTASVPIIVLLYKLNGPLLWGFNVSIKELNFRPKWVTIKIFGPGQKKPRTTGNVVQRISIK